LKWRNAGCFVIQSRSSYLKQLSLTEPSLVLDLRMMLEFYSTLGKCILDLTIVSHR
jgi:hypothetical protein